MRFSVVIPTLGRPEILRRTMTSLAACDPAPSEVIVVDGSDDRSAEPVVADVGRGREGWRYLTGPRGSSHQRNTGIDEAAGDVIVFSDDDVTYAAGVFAVLERAYADPAIAGATTKVIEAADHQVGRKESRLRRLLPGGGSQGTFTRYGYPNYIVDVDEQHDVEFMPGCFMSARTEAARKIRFDEQLTEYGLLEDEDFSFRLTRLGRVVYLPEVTIHHLKTGFATHDKRAFSRKVIVNRSYLFRKNFPQTLAARAQFRMFVAGLFLHRIVNRDREGLRGLREGLREVRAGGIVVKILFVSSHAKLGGAERYLEILLDELPREWERRVVCLEDGPFVERLRSLRDPPVVIHTSRHATGILRSAWRLRRGPIKDAPDVVHANNLKAALVAGLATVGIRVPVVWVKHDFTSDGRLAHFVGRLATKIVGVAEVVTRTFGPAFDGKVSVVHNGIPPIEVDRAAGRKTVDAITKDQDAPVVSLIGRIHPWKGQLELVEVAPRVLNELPNARFLLVGGEDPSTPEYAGRVKRRIDELGVSGSLQMLGQRSDALELMAGSDVVVIPSVPDEKGGGRDAFPYAGLEAMATGTPIVAYSDGGVPELIGDCGRGVPPSDRDGLARAIVDVLRDTDMRGRMADCGKTRVTERFSIAAMVKKMTDIYEDARR